MSQVHLDADGHEERSRGVLSPVPQVQPAVKGLPTCAEVRVAKVPPERLQLVDVSFAIAEVCLLLGAERLPEALLTEVG